MKNFKKLTAFTLAEMLTVIGIIGVVAALTVPNLNSSIGEKDKVAKVKKIHRDLNEAYGRATAVYGPTKKWFRGIGGWSQNASIKFAERMLEFMKVSKNCGITGDNSCFFSGNATYGNGTLDYFQPNSSNSYKILTSDGMSIAFLFQEPLCNDNKGVSCPGPYCQTCGSVIVDIDGPQKGTKTLCKDVYTFYIDSDYGILPQGTMAENNYNTNDKIKNECFVKKDCTGWVIEHGNMDFLKADNNGKCPNNKQLSWSEPTCK